MSDKGVLVYQNHIYRYTLVSYARMDAIGMLKRILYTLMATFILPLLYIFLKIFPIIMPESYKKWKKKEYKATGAYESPVKMDDIVSTYPTIRCLKAVLYPLWRRALHPVHADIGGPAKDVPLYF